MLHDALTAASSAASEAALKPQGQETAESLSPLRQGLAGPELSM